jgi:hypothetical protein
MSKQTEWERLQEKLPGGPSDPYEEDDCREHHEEDFEAMLEQRTNARARRLLGRD